MSFPNEVARGETVLVKDELAGLVYYGVDLGGNTLLKLGAIKQGKFDKWNVTAQKAVADQQAQQAQQQQPTESTPTEGQ